MKEKPGIVITSEAVMERALQDYSEHGRTKTESRHQTSLARSTD